MKIQAKGIKRAANKAEKESEKYKKQAKDALKKNNEEGAKLYLVSASQKRNECTCWCMSVLNYQRTAVKMELMCDQIKSMQNNEKIAQTFTQMTGLVSQQMNQMDTVKMYENMQTFNEKMDEIMINNKMTTEIMNNSNDIADANVDNMMNALKMEVAMEDKNKIIEGGISNNQYNYNTNQQQQQQQQQQMQEGPEAHDPFLDQLKGLWLSISLSIGSIVFYISGACI